MKRPPSKTRQYKAWCEMRKRCSNEHHKDFYRYGGRGIGVCDRWQKYKNFYSDMGERPDGTSLDRINNNDGYYKENCRWANPSQQSANKEHKAKRSGLPMGVYKVKTKVCKYSARIVISNMHIQIGTFLTIAEASAEFLKVYEEWHGRSPYGINYKNIGLTMTPKYRELSYKTKGRSKWIF